MQDQGTGGVPDREAIAKRFGIPGTALVEIERCVCEYLRDRALQLADNGTWIDVQARFDKSRQPLGGMALRQTVNNDLARKFAEALHPIIIESAKMYVEMLTRAIVEHRGLRKPIRWEAILSGAVGFCSGATRWDRSAEWLVKLCKTVNGRDALNYWTPRTRAVFETSLTFWMLTSRPWDEKKPWETFDEIAWGIIHRIVHLAPQSEKRPDLIQLPTMKELRYRFKIVSQKQAAEWLACNPRTIRNYVKEGKLTKAPGGKVRCDDDRFARMLRTRRPNAEVM